MVCRHLIALEEEIKKAGARETTRGQVWTRNCREWVYYDVVLDVFALAERLNLPACVKVHENLDCKSGTERGFYCEECKDGVMGLTSGPKVVR